MAKKYVKKLQFSSSFKQIEKLEPYLNELKQEHELDDKLFSRIRLATNEAVTNAIMHGNREDVTKQVTVMAIVEDHSLQIEVSDEGNGFDPAALPDPRDQENLLAQSGRGVFLIKQYANRVSYSEKGTKVTLHFDLK